MFVQLIKELPSFYGTKTFTWTLHWTLSQASWPAHILISCFFHCLFQHHFPVYSYVSQVWFPTKILCAFLISPRVLNAQLISFQCWQLIFNEEHYLWNSSLRNVPSSPSTSLISPNTRLITLFETPSIYIRGCQLDELPELHFRRQQSARAIYSKLKFIKSKYRSALGRWTPYWACANNF
jgi:hypothetical protein